MAQRGTAAACPSVQEHSVCKHKKNETHFNCRNDKGEDVKRIKKIREKKCQVKLAR
jgi:hypothetical protein